MSVRELTAHVVGVLTRAQSLFASPPDADASGVADRMREAAHASRAIAARAAQLSGATVDAHRNVIAAAGQPLEEAAATDAWLAEHVAYMSATQDAGLSRATELRAGADEVPDRLGASADLPAGELAALKALRNRVAYMQALVADHSGEATRVAGEIRTLGYQA
jgi:hypothetical protein